MPNNRPPRLLFVINPKSGVKGKISCEENIRDYFSKTGHQLEFYELNGAGDANDLQNHIAKFQPDRVIAVGGDGTIKFLAGQLINTNMALGILPAGSANGLAKELNIPLQIEQALEVIDKGIEKKIDVIQIDENNISIHLSDMGLNALLIKYFEQQDRRGMWGYAKVMFRVFRTKRLMRIEADINGEKILRAAYMIVIANARCYGTGASINPQGEVSDGKFEVVIVRRLKLFELIKMLVSHMPFKAENIEVLSTEQVTISTRRMNHFQVDGEYMGKKNKIRAKILPSSLTIVLPGGNIK